MDIFDIHGSKSYCNVWVGHRYFSAFRYGLVSQVDNCKRHDNLASARVAL